ncbi:MAG: alkaline phosphatase family protein [Acidobacteria bacterium]|nr:alkaline phosphatase family protein [Acidobacteriota bacterium]
MSEPTAQPARAGGRRGPALALAVCAFALLLLAQVTAAGRAKRLVVIKIDGLSQAQIDRFVGERDPRTGKSLLPWFRHVFYERGTRVENFYVRGASLSGPSWSMLDTGRHLQIKANVEFDRLTLHSYDYLNFIPFWLGHLGRVRVDMPGTELLDELGVPLLVDSYPYDERHISFQLYQRGTRWTTLERGLKNRFVRRPPRELFDEWMMEFDTRTILMEQLERELIEKLQDPRVRYLDFYSTDFDHAAHHNRDRATHLAALQELDATVGRIWTAVEKTPQAADTAVVVVSDHGTNTDERVYSQGFNLVRLLASAEGGGHHVVTKRRLLSDYAVKSFYPLVPLVYTTSEDSLYLRGQSTDYPTALVDFDGNERATIHLRDADLNLLHVLLAQLREEKLAPGVRRAATDAFFAALERRRADWGRLLAELREEIPALARLIEKQRAVYESMPQKWTKADADAGRDQAARRLFAQIDSWETDVRKYTEYARTLANLLALRRDVFDPARLRLPDIIGVGNRPVDFVALRVPAESLVTEEGEDLRADEAVWLYGGRERQALVLCRHLRGDGLQLRYVPVANLAQDDDGRIRFGRAAWQAELPLKIWEDANVSLPAGARREAWLGGWHTDVEWLRALHLTRYSNAVAGLHEHFARHLTPATEPDVPGLTEDERLVRRLRRRQRQLVESDMLVLASDHWNFDVRGFNPGGNHGSFLRVSTRSTLMFAGGERTGIPRGLAVREPYDSLSFVPTVLTLTGQLPPAGRDAPAGVNFTPPQRPFPGRVIGELFGAAKPAPAVAVSSQPAAENEP